LPSIPGIQQTQGILPQLGQAASGVGTAVKAFSDVRLKENLQAIGITDGGHILYVWDWNEEGKRIAGDQPRIGVIAQEALKLTPEVVHMDDSGYLCVDYSRIH
jgi:hypothetical protein